MLILWRVYSVTQWTNWSVMNLKEYYPSSVSAEELRRTMRNLNQYVRSMDSLDPWFPENDVGILTNIQLHTVRLPVPYLQTLKMEVYKITSMWNFVSLWENRIVWESFEIECKEKSMS